MEKKDLSKLSAKAKPFVPSWVRKDQGNVPTHTQTAAFPSVLAQQTLGEASTSNVWQHRHRLQQKHPVTNASGSRGNAADTGAFNLTNDKGRPSELPRGWGAPPASQKAQNRNGGLTAWGSLGGGKETMESRGTRSGYVPTTDNTLRPSGGQTFSAKNQPKKQSWASRVGLKVPASPVHVPKAPGFQSTTGFNVSPDTQAAFSTSVSGPKKSGALHKSMARVAFSDVSTPNTNSIQSSPRSLATSESEFSSAGMRLLFKKAIKKATREFFQSFEKEEVGRRVLTALEDFGDFLRPEVTKIIVRLGLDQKEVSRRQLVPLLEYLTTERVLRPIEVFNGLYYLAQQIDDVIMDVPDARKMLGELVASAKNFGLSPKQLRQLGTIALNSRPTRRVKDRVSEIIREFLNSNDVKEVARSFIEMKAPHFGHQLIKTAVSMGMDRSRKEMVRVSKLIEFLHQRKAVKPQEMFQGFEKLLQLCEELRMDVPDASERLTDTIHQAIRCGALDLTFLHNVHLLEGDKGFQVIEQVCKRLEAEGISTVPHPSAKDDVKTKPQEIPAPESKKKAGSVKHIQIVDVERETSSKILTNPSFGAPVDDTPSAATDAGDAGGSGGATTSSNSPDTTNAQVKGANDQTTATTTTTTATTTSTATTTTTATSTRVAEGNRDDAKRRTEREENDSMECRREEDNKETKRHGATPIASNVSIPQQQNSEAKSNQHGDNDNVGRWIVPQRRKTCLADFTLHSVVGRGSYGKVFLVRHNKLKTLFAMKVLRKEEIVKRDVVDNIQLERKVLETVDHPFLVALRYAFQTPNKLYMVMDYIPGGELFSLLSNHHELSAKDTRFYAAELVVALEHLHKLNIIYRDLKPENILLHADGHIALTDFGFAKTDIDTDSKTRSFCGTIDYMAPEVIQKTGHGQGADWWALGVVLYEVSVGRMPFDGSNRKATQYSICHHKLRFPRFFDFEMRLLLQGLLRRNIKKRLGSGTRGAEDIKNHEFFVGVRWDIVDKKGLTPPFIPKLKNSTDVSNFDPEFTREPVVDSDSEYPDPANAGSDHPSYFKGFSYDEESPYL
mmetsp:Transcript_15038/g.21077  ORF Transcript_15038/g.21077 Transcript_15038/m.21077 type:complete len:1067 (+) Transcript_15038:189-3389(+)|eukprot:CAMPEP_0184484214 /NCGR_PEP_ID=MMETSP0113_2-20130426/5923_1 /TAXON_ID=91329 /ORGANISM="Norrisiella sphaerica, Strain BC52" /LENGTH=1066 /DNA_ID=CAMNT_0026865087 /DNA_START=293 /DNA_END=3493 /DNA_ORIENTATION=+